MKIKVTFYISLFIALILILAACTHAANTSTDGVISPADPGLGGKKLVVAYDVNYPPFEFLKDGEYTGFDLDLLKAIAAEANITIDSRAMDFNGIIPALQANQVDMAIAAMTIRPDREKVVNFSIPYFRTGLSLAVESDNNDIDSPEDLKGKKVAVKIGTTGESFIRDLPYANEIEIMTFDNSIDTFLAVINGNADATIHDESAVRYYIASEGTGSLKIVGKLLTGDNYGIAVPLGHTETLKAINDALLKLVQNGIYDQIYEKWFGSKPTYRPGDLN